MISEWRPDVYYEIGAITKFQSKLYISKRYNRAVLPIPVIDLSNTFGSSSNLSQVTKIRDVELQAAIDAGLDVDEISLNDNQTWVTSQ